MSEGYRSSAEKFDPNAYLALRVTDALNKYRAEIGKPPFPQEALNIAVGILKTDAQSELGEISDLSKEDLDTWFGQDSTIKKLTDVERTREGVLESTDHVIVDKGGLVLGAGSEEEVRRRMREEGDARN